MTFALPIRIAIRCMLFLAAHMMVAQSVDELQDEIDRTLWKPFQQAFEQLDGHA